MNIKLSSFVLKELEKIKKTDKKHLLKDDIKKRFLSLQIISPKELLEESIG